MQPDCPRKGHLKYTFDSFAKFLKSNQRQELFRLKDLSIDEMVGA